MNLLSKCENIDQLLFKKKITINFMFLLKIFHLLFLNLKTSYLRIMIITAHQIMY